MTLLPDSRLIDEVAGLIRETAECDILPLFGRSEQIDVSEKSPGELVTQVDRNAERRLTEGLRRLLPGSLVIGEETWEGVAPSNADGFGDTPVWTIDPLDGTSAFVQGDPEFAVMVALIQRGETQASWIHAPVPGWMAIAERGAGATLDGRRLRTAETVDPALMQGSVRLRFLPDDTRETVIRAIPKFRRVAMTGSSGWDHVAVANGERHFSLYHRTLIWDHAPGCLVVCEAGGTVARLNGSSYLPLVDSIGLLTACNDEVWAMVREMLLPRLQATLDPDVHYDRMA